MIDYDVITGSVLSCDFDDYQDTSHNGNEYLLLSYVFGKLHDFIVENIKQMDEIQKEVDNVLDKGEEIENEISTLDVNKDSERILSLKKDLDCCIDTFDMLLKEKYICNGKQDAFASMVAELESVSKLHFAAPTSLS